MPLLSCFELLHATGRAAAASPAPLALMSHRRPRMMECDMASS